MYEKKKYKYAGELLAGMIRKCSGGGPAGWRGAWLAGHWSGQHSQPSWLSPVSRPGQAGPSKALRSAAWIFYVARLPDSSLDEFANLAQHNTLPRILQILPDLQIDGFERKDISIRGRCLAWTRACLDLG